MLDLAPARLPPRSAADRPGVFPAAGERKGRVALLRGCAQSVLDPGINDAAIRLLTRQRHRGRAGRRRRLLRRARPSHGPRRARRTPPARRNVDAWTREIEGEGLDAILVTTSGCGTTVKDYGFMLRNDPAYAEKAARVSALAKDISEYLETLDLGAPAAIGAASTVAYHAACSLQHGQQVRTAPKALLARAGFEVREPAEGHLCCGSAGTYNMLQPEIAAPPARPQGREHRGDRRRHHRRRQHRLHDPDRRRHRHAGRPHGRAARLGLWRPEAGETGAYR